MQPVVLTRNELLARREGLLAEVGMTYEELRARAEVWALRPMERAIYEALQSIRYLLGE